MATVKVGTKRLQSSSFALYRTSAGGDESIIVRRKVGEPTDVDHLNSKKLKIQRDNLAMASRHYAQLSPSQKAITRYQIEEVEFQKSHGKTDTKLLKGRQLFIAKEIHSLNATQKPLVLPRELCIMLTDQGENPLSGELWLRYLKNGEWKDCAKEELATGSWLFSKIPRGQEAYRTYGEAPGFFDPRLIELQFMTEEYLLTHRYQKLLLLAGYRSWSFSSRYRYISHEVTPYISHSTLQLNSELDTYNFTGEMIVALWRTGYPYHPDGELCRQTHQISAADPDPKFLYSHFAGLPLQAGVPYWQRLMKNPPDDNLWGGIIRFYELP